MGKLTREDGLWGYLCSWCGRGIKEVDITDTLDGSILCLSCIKQYTTDQDEPDGTVAGFISNIDHE